MRKSPVKKAAGATAFKKVQLRYQLKSPGQIKLRILWFHVQQLIRVQHAGSETESTLAKYDQEWKVCEGEETKRA